MGFSGRAQFDGNGERVCPEELAHDSHDFREYFEEIDATLKFLKCPLPLSKGADTVHEGGCGRVYDTIVMYSHSTGGLVSALYGSELGGAWRGAIDGYIFNSPFWNWNVKWYQGFVLKNAMKAGVKYDCL